MADEVIELPNENIKNAVNRIIEEEGFIDYDITISPGSKKGDNYIGIVYTILIKGVKDNGEKGTLNLICKLPPTNPARRKEFKIEQCFKTEVTAYDQILPKMMKMQEDKGITDGKFDAVAKCCATSLLTEEEFIVMKDLRAEGYVMFDRFKEIDFDHAKLVMENLGKFHAFSFAIRVETPDDYQPYTEFKDVFFYNMEEQYSAYFSKLCDEVKENLGEHETDVKEKITKIQENITNVMNECVSGKTNEPYSVLTHGDCWNNNMLFKYKDGKPCQLKLLDWQICRYASPVLDVLYYIFSCTVQSFREEHYDNLLDVYYTSFSRFLRQLGHDPEELFPLSVFQDQLKKFGKYGFMMALMLVKVITANAEDTPDLDAVAESMQDNPLKSLDNFDAHYTKTKDIYLKRIGGVISDLNRLGYFD